MRYFILFIVLLSCGLIKANLANKFIGSGVLGLFLVAMPLFLYRESKGKDFKDYMLTDENVRKMQGKPPRKSKDS